MLHLRHVVGRSTLRALFLASAAALAVGGAVFATGALAEPIPAVQAASFTSDRLSVEVIGSGPDVILIPGLVSSREVWRPLATRLAATHRVHLVQLAGFAGEPWTHGEGPFLEPVVGELGRYIREQGLDHPAVIGHSMGALVGLRLAQTDPEAMGRLMSVDSLPFFGALQGPYVTADNIAPVAMQTSRMIVDMPDDAFAATQARSAQGMSRDPATREAIIAWSLASDRRAMGAALRDVMTTDARPLLAAMTLPVTALYAADADGGAPAALAEQAWTHEYAALPGVRLIRVDDSRHFIMADQPAQFDELVDEFLR